VRTEGAVPLNELAIGCRNNIVMSSAKLQVRPILLKKISFMIFFNNYLSDYETIRCH